MTVARSTGRRTARLARGFFITFEGGEGAGKSTQIERLAGKLRAKGYDIVVTREPGGSPGAEAVRHVLLSGAAEPFGPKHGGAAFCRRAFRPCRAGHPAGGRTRRDRALRPFHRFFARLSGRDRQPRPRLHGRARAHRHQRHDARHDAHLRHRSGRGLQTRRRYGAARTTRRSLREGDAGHPPAPARGLSGDRASRARSLHRHRCVRRSPIRWRHVVTAAVFAALGERTGEADRAGERRHDLRAHRPRTARHAGWRCRSHPRTLVLVGHARGGATCSQPPIGPESCRMR